MHTINIIEIDCEGEIHPSKQFSFGYLPRIGERIILNNSEEKPNVCKVLDIHHVPNEGAILYITYEKTLQSVLQSLVNNVRIT